MSEKRKFIALIGAGYWGKNILRNLYELGVLHTVCEQNNDIINSLKEKFPDVNYTNSIEQILKNDEIKAVAIATPAAKHYELTKEAIKNNKDVFVEKPLALKVSEAEELVKMAEDKERILMVGHILHYHPAVKKLKELISSGEVGKIQYIYSNRLNIGKIRTEENILWSFAPHDISLMLMILQQEPHKVVAIGGDFLNKGIYDTTVTHFEFSKDVRGHIFVSWLHPFKEQKFVVVGSRSMIVFDDISEEKLFLYRHKIEWKDGKLPIANKADYETIEVEKYEPLKKEMEHFIECVIERKKPITDGNEGIRVLKILELSEKSILNGGEPLENNLHNENFFVHESSYIDSNVKIGDGSKIWHFSHILNDSIVGEKCVIGQNVMIGPNVKIGNRCKIQNNVSIYKGVTLEDEVFVGPSAVFTNVYNPRAFIERKHEFKKTLVKKGATIGANATIVCGVTIGSYAMIGAGAVVKYDVPDHAVVAGVPANQIGWACICGTTIKFNDNYAQCEYCNKKYKISNGKIFILQEED